MTKMTTTQVGSHVDLIQFGAARIPIGFLTSFHKKYHGCAGTGGMTERLHNGVMAHVVCQCCIPRAQQKLTLVGKEGFEALGQAWKDAEMDRVAKSEAACEEEGFQAADGTVNPYPALKDQHLAWRKGHARRSSADVKEAGKPGSQEAGSPEAKSESSG